MKKQSLREKSDRKAGGQHGHEGKTLQCSTVIDTIVEHKPNYCNCCGQDLTEVPEALIETRQVIDIPVIKPVCTEHRIYRKTCSCGQNIDSSFPSHLTAKVQYGAGVEALVGYLHARQYLPYQRMKEFFTDVMGLAVSVGGINNILKRLTQKALPYYEQIKERLYQSVFIGTDETGVKVNGQKDWMWTWQNDELTLLSTPITGVLKPLKILLSKACLIPLYSTTGLPVILIATPCIIRFACLIYFAIYNISLNCIQMSMAYRDESIDYTSTTAKKRTNCLSVLWEK
jgi:transposase